MLVSRSTEAVEDDCYYCSFNRFLISVIVSLIFVVAAGTFVAPKAVIIIIILNANASMI